MMGSLAVSEKSVKSSGIDKIYVTFLKKSGVILSTECQRTFGNIDKFDFFMPMIRNKVLSRQIFLRIGLKRKSRRILRPVQ